MDQPKPNRFRTTNPERFIGFPLHAPPHDDSSPIELTEDDVFFSYDNPQSPSPSSSSSIPIPTRRRHQFNQHRDHRVSLLGPPESFGILAALPEEKESSDAVNSSHFLHDAPVSVSSGLSSSSSTRPIHIVQRPPSDRTPSFSSPSSSRYYHSAPINVPIMSPEMANIARKLEEEEDARDFVEEEEFNKRIPPHEFLAKRSELSSKYSCSLFEGVGRTLKGRDMRNVRNAVLSQTGFLD